MPGTPVTSVTRQRPRDGSGLCSPLKGFLKMTFFGKNHVFPRFLGREPSPALGASRTPTLLQGRTQGTSVWTQRKNSYGFPSCWQKDLPIGARALWPRWRRHIRRKKRSAQKLDKHFFKTRMQCKKPSAGGSIAKHAPPSSGARPPTEQAPQNGTVVGCCAVSCFDLSSNLFYAVFLRDICESFFVLCYSFIFAYFYAGLFFSAVFVFT